MSLSYKYQRFFPNFPQAYKAQKAAHPQYKAGKEEKVMSYQERHLFTASEPR